MQREQIKIMQQEKNKFMQQAKKKLCSEQRKELCSEQRKNYAASNDKIMQRGNKKLYIKQRTKIMQPSPDIRCCSPTLCWDGRLVIPDIFYRSLWAEFVGENKIFQYRISLEIFACEKTQFGVDHKSHH